MILAIPAEFTSPGREQRALLSMVSGMQRGMGSLLGWYASASATPGITQLQCVQEAAYPCVARDLQCFLGSPFFLSFFQLRRPCIVSRALTLFAIQRCVPAGARVVFQVHQTETCVPQHFAAMITLAECEIFHGSPDRETIHAHD